MNSPARKFIVALLAISAFLVIMPGLASSPNISLPEFAEMQAAHADTVGDMDRSVDSTLVQPGEFVEVTITPDDFDGFYAVEESLGDLQLISHTADDYIDDTFIMIDESSFEYEVKVPDDALPGEEFPISGDWWTDPSDKEDVSPAQTVLVVEEQNVGSVTRSVDSTLVQPGEFVEVTITPDGLDGFYAVEEDLGDLQLISHTADDYIDDTFIMIDESPFTYEVKVPDDALPNDEFPISGDWWTDPSDKEDVSPAQTVLTVIGTSDAEVLSVRITNITESSFTATWLNDVPTSGQIDWGDTANLGTIVDDTELTNSETHSVLVEDDVIPETQYFLDILSNGVRDDNGGAHYDLTTGPILVVPPGFDTASGRVLEENESDPAAGCLVYVRIIDNDGVQSPGMSQLQSAVTNEQGFWQVNIGAARTEDLTERFSYDTSGGDLLLIEVECGSRGIASTTVGTDDDDPTDDIIVRTIVIQEIGLNIGFNFVALTAEPSEPMTASTLAQTTIDQGLDVDNIYRLRNGIWDRYRVESGIGTDFPIEVGDGYVLQASQAGTLTLEGLPVPGDLAIGLGIGFNAVGFANLAQAHTASTLAQAIIDQGGDPANIYRLRNGVWERYTVETGLGPDFDIETGIGYIVQALQSSEFRP